MRRFTVDIELDNDAFHPHPEPEVSRLLRIVAERLRWGEDMGDGYPIHDINGNRVGTARIEEVESDE